MIWILATRGASTRLRAAPFTETAIEGVHSVVYKPGIEAIPLSGADSSGLEGTYARGGHRLSGFVFSYHGLAAETLLAIEDAVDLLIRYRAHGENRLRTIQDVIFLGDATVTVPGENAGIAELIGVPFRQQLPLGTTLSDRISDAVDS